MDPWHLRGSSHYQTIYLKLRMLPLGYEIQIIPARGNGIDDFFYLFADFAVSQHP